MSAILLPKMRLCSPSLPRTSGLLPHRTFSHSTRSQWTSSSSALAPFRPRPKALIPLSTRHTTNLKLLQPTPSQLLRHPISTAPTMAPPAVDDPFAHLPPYSPPTTGALSLFPARTVPYLELMRVEKTGGLYAFYLPYLIGLGWAGSIASPPPAPSTLLYTGGILLLWTIWHRGAACTVNDILDASYDRQVARCRLRPVARRAVSPAQAWAWYAAQCGIAVGCVALLPHAGACFGHAAPILVGLSVYPLFKRWTDFPQVVLAAPLAWSIFMTCAAVGVDPWGCQSGEVALATACLFASKMAFFVQLDYVNACQDTTDDVKAGVRSMAVRYQDTGRVLATLGTLQVSLLAAAGWLAGLGPIYFVGACGGNAVIMAAMAKTVDRTKPKTCAWWFLRGSILIGATTITALFAEYASRLRKEETKAVEQ